MWRGAALPDPLGLLAGDGDRMPHARFASLDHVRPEATTDHVRAAVDLNRAMGGPTKRG